MPRKPPITLKRFYVLVQDSERWIIQKRQGVTRIVLRGRVHNPGDKRVTVWDDGLIEFNGDMGLRSRTPRQAAEYLGLIDA